MAETTTTTKPLIPSRYKEVTRVVIMLFAIYGILLFIKKFVYKV